MAVEINRLSPVTVLPGVGRVRAQCYERLGIRTLGDLISHYPRAYENRGHIRRLAEVPEGKASFLLTVATEPRVARLKSHKSFLKFRAFDETASCEIVYFNQDYLKDRFPVGSEFRFFGKLERVGRNGLSLSSPVADPIAPGAVLKDLCPVWPLTEGLTRRQLERDVSAALSLLCGREEDPLPPELLLRRNLCTLSFAERSIHEPQSAKDLLIARRRLAYQEFFDFALGAALLRKQTRSHEAPPCREGNVTPLLDLLPYRLTGAQARVIEEVRRDMARSIPMGRMIVGDVGCGKTVCAAAAMLIAVQSGRQAALMAPTEILATQHYQELSVYFSRLGVSCALLTGSTPAAEKRRIRQALAEEDPRLRLSVVIGTHALLSEGVTFHSPGLVVTDEQHRFGAAQRATLSEKNAHAHLLVMSATPIPRSLALILYGDLELSRIDEMPPGRQRVDTFAVDDSYRERLNGFMEKQMAEGGQVYVVCPAVEEQETPEDEVLLRDFNADGLPVTEEKPPLKAAVPFAEELAKRFPNRTVAFLHGRLKSGEKDDVMRRFSGGEIDLLVSTTVIEVGVNVPNATLMVVENAERFGLSQLHQLRGRVGRGSRKSYCILVAGGEGALSEGARRRLNVMRTTYDGYAIAEQDLAQRGPGDFLGTGDSVRQSGALCFRIANAAEDASILSDASEDARALLTSDPTLAEHPALAHRADRMFTQKEGMIS